MDRLHVLAANSSTAVVVGGARLSSSPVIPFGPVVSFDKRVWWYDVHQVEGAV